MLTPSVTSTRAGTRVILTIECADAYAAIQLHDRIVAAAAAVRVTIALDGETPPKPR